MRGVSVGGGGGVDDRVMCFSINWSMSASEDWFLFRPCVGSGWGDGDLFRGFTCSLESDEVLGRPFMIRRSRRGQLISTQLLTRARPAAAAAPPSRPPAASRL